MYSPVYEINTLGIVEFITYTSIYICVIDFWFPKMCNQYITGIMNESQNIFIFIQYAIFLVHTHAVSAKNFIITKFSLCANNLHIIKNISLYTYLYRETITGIYLLNPSNNWHVALYIYICHSMIFNIFFFKLLSYKNPC